MCGPLGLGWLVNLPGTQGGRSPPLSLFTLLHVCLSWGLSRRSVCLSVCLSVRKHHHSSCLSAVMGPKNSLPENSRKP